MECAEDDVEVKGLSMEGVFDFRRWDSCWSSGGELDELFNLGYILGIEGKNSAILGDCRIFHSFGGEFSIVPGHLRFLNPSMPLIVIVSISKLFVTVVFSSIGLSVLTVLPLPFKEDGQ